MYQKENIQYDFTYKLQKMQTNQQRWKSDQALPKGEARRKTGGVEAPQSNSEVEDAVKSQRGFHGCNPLSKAAQLYTSNICTLY